MTSAKKALFVKTYGCQMNVYDSGRMVDLLSPLGYETVESPEHADMVIINTCHIREKATEKVFSELGRFKKHKDKRAHKGKDTIIAVAGCVAQAEGEEIMSRAPYVNMVFGPQTYHRLPEMIAQATRAIDQKQGPGRGILDVDFPIEPKFDFLPEIGVVEGGSGFLTIQEGCDKFCHFCCVPYTRGAEFSRPIKDIIIEAEQLLAKGVKDITLLGQNVNAYHGEGPDGTEWGLGRLLYHMADMPGLKRLRYTTSHPRDVDDELIAAHRDLPVVMPYIHLPVQSGSDHILKAMNRRHTSDEYREIIRRFREVCPDAAFSSDFIVGYPGESEKDFEDTMQLVRDVFYAQCFSFKYSPRHGTPAAALELQVPEEVKTERLERLQSLLKDQQLVFNESCVGKRMSILLEKPGRKAGQVIGKSAYLQSVHVEADASLIGQIIDVEITSSGQYGLEGRVAPVKT
jgi:tRNA-2-methylthio-N6-dimethylallyladenosine synthase